MRWRGGIACAAALALALWVFGPTRVGAGHGDWRSVTHGLRLNEAHTTLVGKRTGLVHFHELRGHDGSAELRLSPRAVTSALHVFRDGLEVASMPRFDSPRTLRVEIPPGRDHVEMEIAVESLEPVPPLRPTFSLDEVALRRGAYWLAVDVMASGVLALVVVFALAPASWPATIAGAFVAAAASVWAVAVVEDPTALLAVSDPIQMAWRVAALAGVWALATWRPPTRWTALAAIAATVIVLYLPTLRYGFITDDFFFARPLSVPELASTLWGSWDPKGAANTHYRPLVALSLALDYALWGARTAGYHLTNLLLGILGACIAWRLLAHLDVSTESALAGAMAWVAHPMSAAAVSWANERTDGVMAIFYLGALALLTRPVFGRREQWGFVLCAMAALASKEMAVTLPAAAAGLCLVRRDSVARWKAVALVALITLVFVAAWMALFPGKAHSSASVGLRGASGALSDPATTALGILVPVFAPTTYHDWDAAAVWAHPVRVLVVAAIVAAAAIVAVRRPTRAAWLAALGVAWPLFTYAPLLPLRGDRDVYRLGLTMAFGFALVWSPLWATLRAWNRAVAALATATLAVWLGWLAIGSSQAWGMGGFAMTSGTRWKAGNDGWLRALSPGMRELFARQAADFAHRTEEWR